VLVRLGADGAELLAAGDVPEGDLAVTLTGGKNVAAGRQGDAAAAEGYAPGDHAARGLDHHAAAIEAVQSHGCAKAPDLLAAGDVPNAEEAVRARRDDVFLLGGEAEAGDRRRVPPTHGPHSRLGAFRQGIAEDVPGL